MNSSGAISIDTNGQAMSPTSPGSALAASNSGGLTKLGAGRLTLTGSNLYTGVTNVTAGTLAFNAIAANGSAQPLAHR